MSKICEYVCRTAQIILCKYSSILVPLTMARLVRFTMAKESVLQEALNVMLLSSMGHIRCHISIITR